MATGEGVQRRLSRRVVHLPPPVVLSVLYALLIAAGTLALMLPIAQAAPFSAGDALFTAVSAVTVTGLGVFELAEKTTLFGQAVVLVLIQLGGLGLMTFAVMVLSSLGLPVSMTQSAFLREDLNQTSLGRLLRLVESILKVVMVAEAIGTAMLAVDFIPSYGFGPGLWHALFHSVSAFNNAGFSTLPAGLVPYAADPLVNLTIPALFIVGGIGYGVLVEIATLRRWRPLSLHAKLMLIGTAALIVFGVAVFAILEWDNPGTLGTLDSVPAKLLASWFQGVTTRTAGFNTLSMEAMEDSTTTMFIAMMIVGAGPTSTGGGIKVTTVIVMILATVAFFRRQTELHAFGRSIGLDQVLKVTAVTAISFIVVFTGVFLLTLSHQGDFLDLAFEVASAFGTVGLSRGETTSLDGFGRTVIMAIMFIGRVGPLTLGFFLATRTPPRVRYPGDQIYVG
jgi:trk system potassium uptake protein TrkH